MDFSSTSVVVTGAGKGIDRATAIMMAEQGADVAALSRTRSDLDRLKEETGCRTIAVDIADPAAARAAMVGTCDHLVNCASTYWKACST